MSRFRRNRPAGPPAWASSLNADEFTEFSDHLERATSPHGRLTLGDGFLTIDDRQATYGLTNLLQQWKQMAPAGREDLVRNHFANLFTAEAAKPLATAQLLDVLRPRLHGSSSLAEGGVTVVSRSVAEGIDAVLCVDLPTHVATINLQQAEATGQPVAELWRLAIAQIDDGVPVTSHSGPHGEVVTYGDSFFVASRLLDLERFAGPMPMHGALVAVPHRHMMILRPVDSVEVVEALNTMIPTAARLYEQGPGSIVPHVYWWRSGTPLTTVPAILDGGQLSVYPPDDLITVLQQLPAD